MKNPKSSQFAFLPRFTEVFTRLAGREPPDFIVLAWFKNESNDLQEFALNHGPSWAQGIELIDAAINFADNGVLEGESFESYSEFKASLTPK